MPSLSLSQCGEVSKIAEGISSAAKGWGHHGEAQAGRCIGQGHETIVSRESKVAIGGNDWLSWKLVTLSGKLGEMRTTFLSARKGI